MGLLEKHFDLAFAAPDGIKKVRELILTLAMQGKLVPQDPNDPPASELLKEIEAEKKRLVKEGKIKQSKPLQEIKPQELPYELPNNWQWVKLGEIGEVNPRNVCEDDIDVGFVPMPLIFAEYRSSHKFETKKWSEIKKGYTHFANGDVAVAKITPCFENGKSCVFNGLPNAIGAGTTELHVFRNTFNSIYPNYLLAYFKNPRYIALGASKMTGSAGQKRVPTEFFSLNPFPLPPLAEQRRIVAKIDELMARCDELEKLRSDRTQKRITVHTAALNRLMMAKDSSDFSTVWGFITQHFSELYSVKENVAELRKAILQLAVMGKLVPQDPNDQPASELLKAIAVEKQRLVKEGKIKQPKPLPDIKSDDVPYKLPDGWSWCYLDDVCTLITDGTHYTPTYSEIGIPFISVKDISSGIINFSATRFISEQEHKELVKRCHPERGDVLLTKVGTTGIAVAIDTNVQFSIFVSVALLKLVQKLINTDYVTRLINSPLVKKYSTDGTEGVGNKNLVLRKIKVFLIPLPPLNEQQRIVTKIDELMALCDNIEKQIDNANSKQTDLLNAVMAQV